MILSRFKQVNYIVSDKTHIDGFTQTMNLDYKWLQFYNEPWARTYIEVEFDKNVLRHRRCSLWRITPAKERVLIKK